MFIIRHAKAETVFTLNDFERPLNDRGKKDAPEMARRLFQKKIKIDAFVSSPAKRAKKTALLFSEVFGQPEGDIIFISALYHAPVEIFYEVIEQLNDGFDTVAVFAHNPGITDFANSLTAAPKVDNMPTCSLFAVNADINSWSDFAKAKKYFLFFDYPKNL